MITAELVKNLREKTGAGMMDCKKVLTETNGDMDKAIELLRERGIAKAAKKSDRIAAEGLVETYITENGKIGAVVEVNSETDFVAKNQEFVDFVKNIAKQVAEKNPANVDDLLNEKYIADEAKTVSEVLTEKIATIGENMSIRRFSRFESNGLVQSYIHGAGKIAVLVDMEKGTGEVAKDVCMQIAAARPEYVRKEDVPEAQVSKEMEILKAQAMNEGKPEQIAEKMVQGRIGKFYSEICLLEQPFVKEADIKVGKMLEDNGAEVVRFARFEKGEGLEKREEVPETQVAKEMEILKAQAMNEGKPEQIAEKMVQGRIGKFYSEICLLEQPFVKEADIKVGKMLENNNAQVVRFARFEKGEGLEKREENFAEEVMKQINN